MDGRATRSAEDEQALRVAQVHWNDADPVGELTRRLGPGPFELICLFVSPRADFHALNRAAKGAFGRADVFACTTAGEIGATGYEEGQIIAIGFPSSLFSVDALVIDGLDSINDREVIDRLMQRRLRLSMEASDMTHEFAFLLVDRVIASGREHRLGSGLCDGADAAVWRLDRRWHQLRYNLAVL